MTFPNHSSQLPEWCRFVILVISVMALTGCTAMKRAWIAPSPAATEIERHHFPGEKGSSIVGRLAVVRLEEGDTLPDIARHFGLGLNALTAANPGVDVWLPEPGASILLPLSFTLPDAPRTGVVINLAAMRLFQYRGNGPAPAVSTYPVGIGTSERPTPQGQMHVARKAVRPTWHVPASIAADHRKKGDPLPAKVPPGPLNPLGEYALYLSKAGYLIHGTNKPASIGLKASNGCLRLYPEDVKTLFNDTSLDTSVQIVNQPYLIGQRDGVLYLEAHAPLENPAAAVTDLEKINEKLRDVEKRSGRSLDWKKVKAVQTEARGIPIPLLELEQGRGEPERPIELAHPGKLYGRPELPELKLKAWYVSAGDSSNEREARRLAAIINHQGPPIPARVIPKDKGYRIIAGPFNDAAGAREAARRLKIDLEIDGVVIPPDSRPET